MIEHQRPDTDLERKFAVLLVATFSEVGVSDKTRGGSQPIIGGGGMD